MIKYKIDMTLRIPILPLKYTQEYIYKEKRLKEDIDIIFDYLGVKNIYSREKYLKRMSFRTIPLLGMVSENNVSIGNVQKISINKMSVYSFKKFTQEDNIILNSRIQKKENSFTVNNNGIITKLEYSGVWEDFFSGIEYGKVYTKEKLRKLYSSIIKENNFEKSFNYLYSENILMDNKSLNKIVELPSENRKGYLNRENYNNKGYIKIPKRSIETLSKYLEIFLSNIYNETYTDLIEYFIDKYGVNTHVSVMELYKDRNIMTYIKKKQSIKYSEELIKLMESKLDKHNQNEESFEKSISNLKTESREYNFDIHTNILEINDKIYINLDNQKSISNLGSTNLYVSGKNESINYIEDEEELNVLLNKNRIMKKNIDTYNYDYIDIGNKDFSNIEVGYDKYSKKFYTYDSKSKKIVKFNLYSNVNHEYLDDFIRLILYLSDYNNIKFELLPKLEEYTYIPRVMISNIILYRERYIIRYNENSYKNVTEFGLYVKKIVKNRFLEYVIVIEDYEIQIDFEHYEDIDYLYKILKRNKEIIIKENIQKYSFLKINEQRYSNELIITFYSKNNNKINVSNKNKVMELKEDILDEWIYFKVFIDTIVDINFFKDLKKLAGKDLFFYIYYIENQQCELRIRLKNVDKILKLSQILKKNKLINFVITIYEKETGRYAKSGIENFEYFSFLDSKRVIDYLVKEDNDYISETRKIYLTTLNTLYFIKLFKLKDEEIVDILDSYNFGKEDRKKYKYYKDIIEDILGTKEYIKFNKINKDIVKKIDYDNYLDLIHLSNIRLLPNEIIIEREVYKYISIYFKKKLWKSKKNILKKTNL